MLGHDFEESVDRRFACRLSRRRRELALTYIKLETAGRIEAASALKPHPHSAPKRGAFLWSGISSRSRKTGPQGTGLSLIAMAAIAVAA
jgi:hypothetical protein